MSEIEFYDEIVEVSENVTELLGTQFAMQQQLIAMEKWLRYRSATVKEVTRDMTAIEEKLERQARFHTREMGALNEKLGASERSRKAHARRSRDLDAELAATREQLKQTHASMQVAQASVAELASEVSELRKENQRLTRVVYAHAAEHGMTVVEEYDGSLSLVPEKKRGWLS